MAKPAKYSQDQLDFLQEIANAHYLPVARFILKSTTNHHFESVAMAPVFIEDITDPIPKIKEMGEFLLELEMKELITIDYGIPISKYDYEDYSESFAYKFFQDTVNDGKRQTNFIADTAVLEKGSIALTLEALELIK